MTATRLPPGIDLPKKTGPNGTRISTGLVRARYRDSSGKQFSKSWPDVRAPRGGGKSGRTLAKEWLAAQQVAVRDGSHIRPNDKRTLTEYALRQIELNPALRDSTRRNMIDRIKHFDATGLGRQPMQSITRSDVQAWVADRSKVLAPRNVRTSYGLIKSTFVSALADGIVASTPCVKIALPAIEDDETTPLTVAQVQRIAAAMPERYRIGVVLAGALGLRIGELLGLQRRDVDLHRRVVHVRAQLGTDGHSFVALKSRSSKRTAPLAAPVALALAAHIAEYQQDPDETLLLTPMRNPVTRKVFSERFRAALKAVDGLPEGVTPHSLRHHCASLLIASGVPVNVAAAHLGHADGGALLLRTYAHLLPTAEDVARAALDAAWSGSTQPVSQTVSWGRTESA